jgi:hypothetical protein
MDSLDGKISHSCGSKGATITNAFLQDAPSKGKLITVFPDGLGDFEIGIGLYLPYPIGHVAGP